MKKEILVFLGIGVIFSYLIMNFAKSTKVRDDSIGSGTEYDEGLDSEKLKTEYVVKDALGDPTLDFSNAPMNAAKAVWRASDIRKNMLNYFPKFNLMKDYVHNRLLPSPFRKALLNKIEDVEDKYLTGKISSEEAISRLKHF